MNCSLQEAPLDISFVLLLMSYFVFVSLRWFAKRFLHPDIVASYEYIFLWDEDLGVEYFDAGR